MNILSKLNLLPNQKLCLTIEEAAIYSMLGENRLRKIIEENRTLDWVLYVGSWIRIKDLNLRSGLCNKTIYNGKILVS